MKIEDANVGVVRELTLEPNILSARGYIQVTDDVKKLKDVNLFGGAEMLTPGGVTEDDASRTAMAVKQAKHSIPIVKSSPVLISNGSDHNIAYHLGDDFIIKAKNDGVVVERNEELGMVMLEYKDKSYQAIDIKPRVVKNGAGGFYLSNKLECGLKKGDKFKKNDLLAHDSHFFSKDNSNGTRFNTGSFQKVACMSTYSTFEDGTFITRKLSDDMASNIVYQRQIPLGKNANVDFIVKVGDFVTVGDPLVVFENSFDEENLNKFLATVGKEMKEEIKNLGKVPIKAKVSGMIEDIKLYCSTDLENLSPSLRKIVKDYYTTIDKKKKLVGTYDKSEGIYKAGMLFNEPSNKIDATRDGKIKGIEINEGVLLEIYIRYQDRMAIGDKITYFAALKSIVGEVLPEGYEPYTSFRPDEEVSSAFAPGALLDFGRM
jgi:DNA-directed RNA polymerase beta subunit